MCEQRSHKVAQRDGFYLQQKLKYFHSYWHSNNMMYYQYYLSTKDNNKTHFRRATPPLTTNNVMGSLVSK